MTEYKEGNISFKKVAPSVQSWQLPVTINTIQVRHFRWLLASLIAPFTWLGVFPPFLAAFAHVQGRHRLRLRYLRVDAKIEGVHVIICGSIDVELSVPLLPQLRPQAVSRNLDGIFLLNFLAPFGFLRP
jgi:hypothetical protein